MIKSHYKIMEIKQKAYDKVALQNHGNKAKTNYDYTKEEIEKILQEPKILKLE